MKFPKTIQIAGLIFEIKEVPGLLENEDCVGLSDFDTQEILIEKNQSEQSKELSLIHELVHLIEILLGYKNQENPMPHDEVFINSFSNLWHQVTIQLINEATS